MYWTLVSLNSCLLGANVNFSRLWSLVYVNASNTKIYCQSFCAIFLWVWTEMNRARLFCDSLCVSFCWLPAIVVSPCIYEGRHVIACESEGQFLMNWGQSWRLLTCEFNTRASNYCKYLIMRIELIFCVTKCAQEYAMNKLVYAQFGKITCYTKRIMDVRCRGQEINSTPKS